MIKFWKIFSFVLFVQALWSAPPEQWLYFETRAFIYSIEEAIDKIVSHGAICKGDYAFDDYIYHPLHGDFDLNKEFIRIRVFQKTNWDQLAVELVHKVRGGIYAVNAKFKKQFNSIEEAQPFLHEYKYAFSYHRHGMEYELGNVRIFIEQIEGLPSSIELLSNSNDQIDQLFEYLAPVQILTDSIPKLIERRLAGP